MKKAIFAGIFAIFIGASFLVVSNPQSVSAAECSSYSNNLFGLPTWYRGLVNANDKDCRIKSIGNGENGSVTIQQFVWTIIGNIFDGIFRIAGVVAVGFIIWAGFQYMISSGDSGKMAAAKTTLTNAIIGLIIAVLASIIVQFVMGIFSTGSSTTGGINVPFA